MNLSAGFKAVESKNFGIAQTVFKREIVAWPSLASYGFFKIYVESKDFYSLDSAWNYLHKSLQYFALDSSRLTAKKHKFYQTMGWTRSNLLSCYQTLASAQLSALALDNDHQKITTFIQENPQYFERNKAIRFRDSLWLSYCDDKDYFCVLGLNANSPDSEFKEDVLDLLDSKSFEEWVITNSEIELSNFIKYHPSSRYAVPAQDELYRIFIQTQDTNAFKRFLKDYPTNRNRDKIWKAYFYASIGNYDPLQMAEFLAIHPDYPFKNQVIQELQWYGKTLFPVLSRNGQYGFMDEEGHLVIDFAYDEVNDFHEGLAAVVKNDRHGVITTNGEVAVDFIYDLISDFQSGHAIVKIGERFGLLDRNGKNAIEPLYEDLQFVFSDLLLYLEGGLYGLMSNTGQVLVPPTYLDFLPIGESYALVTGPNGKGVLHASLSTPIPIQYQEIQPFKEGFMVKKYDKLGIIDVLGRTVVPCEYDEVIPTCFPFLTVRKDQKIMHISTKSWRLATVPTDVFEGWREVTAFNGTNFLIQRKGVYYWADSSGKLTKAPKFFTVEYTGHCLVGNLLSGGNWGIFDRKGNALTTLSFQDIQLLENGSMKVMRDGKVGLYDSNGAVLIDALYDEIVYWPRVNLHLTEINGKQGVINVNGKTVLENKYTSVKMYSDEFLSINLDSQVLYYNFISGKMVKLNQ